MKEHLVFALKVGVAVFLLNQLNITRNLMNMQLMNPPPV
jgi:hypothetical protein